MNLTVLKV